jgi:hypothetical protein
MNAPNKNNTAMIGTIHHRRPPKYENSSPTVLSLRAAVLINFIDDSP